MNPWWYPFFNPPQEIWCCKSKQKQKHYWFGEMTIFSSGWCGLVNVDMSTLLFKVQGLIWVHVIMWEMIVNPILCYPTFMCFPAGCFDYSKEYSAKMQRSLLGPPHQVPWNVAEEEAERMEELQDWGGGPWHATFRTQHSYHSHELTVAEQDLHKLW